MFSPVYPRKPRPRRNRRRVGAPPTPVGLTLVAASFDNVTLMLRLVFNEAVNIDNSNAFAITVQDGPEDKLYLGQGLWSLFDPVTVDIEMQEVSPGPGASVILNAAPDNGIVALDDAEPWVGVTDLVLPFP
jgi:hypothetical protein